MPSTNTTTQQPSRPQWMPIRTGEIPDQIKAHPRWLLWRWTWNADKAQWDKPPLQANGRKAKSNDPKTWTTFSSAATAATSPDNFDGVGFSLHSSEFVGVDLDDCRDPVTGEIREPAASIIRHLDSYTEVSPSRTGVKLLVTAKLAEKTKKVNHDTGVEVYNNQYFTITGYRLSEAPRTINDRQAQVDWLLATFVDVKRLAKSKGHLDGAGDDIETARSALAGLRAERAEGYWDWLQIGMALKSVSDSLLPDWDNWSKRSAKYAEGVCAGKWRSFNGHGVGLGTLIHFAKQDGWTPPRSSTGTSKETPALVEAAIAELPNRVVTNGMEIEEEQEDGSHKKVTVALSMTEILDRTREQTKDWPRRIDNVLFVHDPVHGVAWQEKPAALFGWFARTVGQVTWYSTKSTVGKNELFEELRRTAPRYAAVEALPHEPPMEGHYYACENIEPGDGKHLGQLIERFCPATEVDGHLIRAAFLTPMWGGPAGCRPCFPITSDDGRGSGKSTLAEMIGDVYGGVLQFSHLEDIGTIKTRLLSPEALPRRVALLDNVKTLRFSWAELEGMITASTIGGHRMYVGEAVRPNTLTWFVTLNGAALSCDMAQRSVIIKIRRPQRTATWAEDTRQFIRQHQLQILGDIIAALRGPVTPLARFTRWATWERDVLQRLPDPAAAQALIMDRQAVVDVDAEEAGIIEDYFAEQLGRLKYDTQAERIFIPSQHAARWYVWATNDRQNVGAACRILTQLATEGRLPHLQQNKCKSWGRGFVWHGEQADVMTPTAVDLTARLAEQLAKGRAE